MTFSVSPSVKFWQRDRGNAQLYSRAKNRRKHTKKRRLVRHVFFFFFCPPAFGAEPWKVPDTLRINGASTKTTRNQMRRSNIEGKDSDELEKSCSQLFFFFLIFFLYLCHTDTFTFHGHTSFTETAMKRCPRKLTTSRFDFSS